MRIFYLIDGYFRAGGQLVNLAHVRALRRMGLDASFWILRPEGEPAEYAPPPPPADVPWRRERPDFRPDDVLVIGEMFGAGAVATADAPARKIIHNQGPYLSFEAFIDVHAMRAWGAEALICPSEHAAGMLRRIGWTGPLHVVRPMIDPVFLAPAEGPRALQILAVTAKRHPEVRLIRGILRSLRPDLAEVPWSGVTGASRAEVARRMRGSEILLATGEREGLGLPPLEGLASGCLVAGFHGGGGRVYATPENGDWFDDDRHVEIAQALATLIDRLRAGEDFAARRAAGRAAAEGFSQAVFERQLRAAWTAILGLG